MLLSGKLKDEHDIVAFLRQELSLHPEVMSPKQQERVAAGIVGLAVNDKFASWQQQYQILGKIFDLAVDLEGQHVLDAKDIPAHWGAIAQLVGELDDEIRSSGTGRH